MYATPHPVYPYDPSTLSHLTNQHSALPTNQLVPTSTTSGKLEQNFWACGKKRV